MVTSKLPRECSCVKPGCGGDVCCFTTVYGSAFICVDCGEVVTGARLTAD